LDAGAITSARATPNAATVKPIHSAVEAFMIHILSIQMMRLRP
jgi:hypothetical protein